MFRQTVSVTSMNATAVALLLLAGSPAAAQQQGWVVNRGAYNGYAQGSAVPAPRFYAPPAYNLPLSTFSQVPVVAPSASPTETSSFYFSPVGDEGNTLSNRSAVNRPVTINVSVPSGAAIAFDGTPTVQSRARRAFVSPPLDPGRDYAYDVTATWQDGGREVSRTRHITVHSGDVINLQF